MKKDARELTSCELFFHYFYFKPFKSFHRENKFREGLDKDPVANISSTEFIVFGPAKLEQSFCKISALQIIGLCSPNELLYSYI